LQGKLDMPPRCAACPANMYADHSLWLALLFIEYLLLSFFQFLFSLSPDILESKIGKK